MTVQANTLSAGVSFLRFKRSHEDVRTKAEAKAATKPMVSIFTGQLTLPGDIRCVVTMKAVDRNDHYEVTVQQAPRDNATEPSANDWKTLANFTLPFFKGAPYVEGSMTIGTRKFIVRMTPPNGGDYLRLYLPQVVRGAKVLANHVR